ncbi:MAG: hypothetical protein HKO95_00275 [Rhodobacteraceae bacterium]|nr:hypothetical protein [Alphaproteobacteria bacterium]MBT8474051.1 hypothetical protein [Alphaproteobacteria bacterium]NNK65150.1 hypothetical protein [Paracoccaceae bacterium]
MRLIFPVLIAMFTAFAASAETPMTAEEFDAHTRGNTLTFSADGQVYGIEEYLDGRRVRWAFVDGTCEDGFWYTDGPMICFVYETISDPQCWTFYRRGDGLKAQYENEPDGTVLFETQKSPEPLLCRGPEVGV